MKGSTESLLGKELDKKFRDLDRLFEEAEKLDKMTHILKAMPGCAEILDRGIKSGGKNIFEIFIEAVKKNKGINLKRNFKRYFEHLDEGKRKFELSYSKHMGDHFKVMDTLLADYFEKGYLKGTIFDLGCGTTITDWIFLLRFYFEEAENRLIGVDSSPYMLVHGLVNHFYMDALVGLMKESFSRLPEDKRDEWSFFYQANAPRMNFYQQNMTQLDQIVEKEGQPDTIMISYCFHWLNKTEGLVEKMAQDIHHHLKKEGYFISIEEFPLNIGFEKDPAVEYVKENTNPFSRDEELYPLIEAQGFEPIDLIIYNIDRQEKLEPGTFSPQHEMYGRVFRKK